MYGFYSRFMQPFSPYTPPAPPGRRRPDRPPYGPPFGRNDRNDRDDWDDWDDWSGRNGQLPGSLPPPPAEVPAGPAPYRVDPGAIRNCRNRYTYIYLDNGVSFWFYPVFVGRTSIAGYRWSGWRWFYFGVDLDEIRSFTCF